MADCNQALLWGGRVAGGECGVCLCVSVCVEVVVVVEGGWGGV